MRPSTSRSCCNGVLFPTPLAQLTIRWRRKSELGYWARFERSLGKIVAKTELLEKRGVDSPIFTEGARWTSPRVECLGLLVLRSFDASIISRFGSVLRVRRFKVSISGGSPGLVSRTDTGSRYRSLYIGVENCRLRYLSPRNVAPNLVG
jgi:hypothetical protein